MSALPPARALLLAAILGVSSLPAAAQQINPVYTDDSPVAAETFARIADFLASKNDAEAVRELQKLLDDQPDRVVPVQGQPDLFVGVRARVHAVLLSSPRLLDLYRAAETARAQQELDGGDPDSVERARLLTRPGFEAALRVAQSHLEAAHFDAALLTLEQLEDHPDRKTGGDPARDAASLLAQVARYVSRPDVLARAAHWATQAGLPTPSISPVAPPPALRAPLTTFLSPSGALDASGIPPRALWSTAIEPIPVPADVAEAAPDENNGEHLWILPSVWGDTVFVNDGDFITARDRFTLQPRWSVRPVNDVAGSDDPWAARRSIGRARQIEDTATVSIAARTLVATMGVAQGGDRDGESATFALDAPSGRVLWAAQIARLDPQLDNATVRGPALIDGGTVVIPARKTAQGRRIVSFYLAGLSLQDGSLRWLRPIASAGAIPWGRGDSRIAGAPLLSRGIIYCVDHLGVIAAVEATTGRPLWVRRDPVPALGNGIMPEPSNAFSWSTPIADDQGVIVLAPDRSEVLRLDRRTGAVLARRSAADLGSPSYLLAVGDRLAAVANDAISFVPLDKFDSAPIRRSRNSPSPGIRGRVVVAGDLLLVPRPDGLAIVSPSDPAVDPTVLHLDHIGNALPLSSQLLIVDGASIHSYLTWTVAERLLQDRMAADPADPDPAVTYADLAFRSNHPDQIAPAADKALAAIDKAPTADASRASRQRLFRVLLDMAEHTENSWAAEPAAPAPGAAPPNVVREPTPRPGQPRRRPAATPVKPDLPVLDLPHLAGVIDRLGRAAQAPDERVSHLIALGRLRDAQASPALAAEAYQQILAEPTLAAASWRAGGSAVRAELEATRRVRALVLDRGPAVYAAFDAEAARAVPPPTANPAPQDLERLARRFPAAAVTPALWARAAEGHDAAGRPYAAVAALREGLSAAESATAAGSALEPNTFGELGGRLATRLRASDQLFAAAQVVTRLRSLYPTLILYDHGKPIDADSLTRELVQRLAGLQRFPRIGPEIRPDTQPLVGWAIMVPRSREAAGHACEHAMLISPAESKVALWGVPSSGAEPGAHLQMLWSRPYSGIPPIVLRQDPDSVYLFWERTDTGDGAVIERISAVGGETRWRTEPFRGLFPVDEEHKRRVDAARGIMEAPVEGPVRLSDVQIAMDEQAIAVVERSGRAAAFDPASGRLLWHSVTRLTQVHDICAGAGVIALGGAAPPEHQGGPLTPILVILDERTGSVLHTLDTLAGVVRWTRISPAENGAAVIAGLASQVDSIDTATARTNWSIVGGAAFDSLDAWVFSDRLFLLDQHRTVYTIPTATGLLPDHPSETYEHLTGSGLIEATPIGQNRRNTAFTSDRGVCVLDPKGELIAMDAIDGGEAEEGSLLPPVITDRYFVAIESQPRQSDSGPSLYRLHLLDTASGALRATRALGGLEMPPRRVLALDGCLLITAGPNTVVYPTPEGEPK